MVQLDLDGKEVEEENKNLKKAWRREVEEENKCNLEIMRKSLRRR